MPQVHMDQKAVDKLYEVVNDLHKLTSGAMSTGADDTEDDDTPHTSYEVLSVADVERQQTIFTYFDVDGSEQLAQLEIRRLCKAMKLFDDDDQIVAAIKQMDVDNSGTIDFEEYLGYIDARCSQSPEFHKEYRVRSKNTKLGFDGTTWRTHANTTWMMNNGMIIVASGVVLTFLIYFDFILVPMTMAYFMTFLLGPIQDLLIQRPLICNGLVCCDEPCFRPALKQDKNCCGKRFKWDDNVHRTPTARFADHSYHKEVGQWNSTKSTLRWEDGTPDCCYFLPSKKFAAVDGGGGMLVEGCWGLISIAQIPESLSVLMTIAIAIVAIAAVATVVSAEIIGVLADPEFQNSLKVAMTNFNQMLIDDYEISITELREANLTASWSTVEEMNVGQISEAAAPLVLVMNETVLTLLLCLYMLATRSPENEEDKYREVQRMSIGEKIQSKVKHYVVLKTALSALTGGLVGLILALCKVRLSVLFGLLTFLFNYIPNVGSMIAMMLPIPVIIVDTLPEDDYPGPEVVRKSLAFLGPAVVQAYVGNVLEPAVFGKSLNVTAISVLIALVLWGSIWGLQGAILSVPMLAAFKILLEEADHPMAKMMLRVIRESAAIDDAVESQKTRAQRNEARQSMRNLEMEDIKSSGGGMHGLLLQNPLNAEINE